MIVLKDALGNELTVNSEEQAKFWESVGYTRGESEPKKSAARKSSSSKSSK